MAMYEETSNTLVQKPLMLWRVEFSDGGHGRCYEYGISCNT